MKYMIALFVCLLGLLLMVTGNNSILFIFLYPFIYPMSEFASFPIEGLTNLEGSEYIQLSKNTRIVFSIVWYTLLLVVLAVIPLCFAKRFKSHSFYQAYKVFWLCAALVFSSITAALIGIRPIESSQISGIGILSFVIWYVSIASMAIIPAYLQYRYYNKS